MDPPALSEDRREAPITSSFGGQASNKRE